MERRVITVRGIVQGVGFRPFVSHLAEEFRLNGFVQNRTGTVFIEVEGQRDALERFVAEIANHPPPLAQIDAISWEPRPALGASTFCIAPSSDESTSPIFISSDVATCADCRRELFDPADRRYRYPFSNCTNCGPRLTIITGAPYDRPKTTMRDFPMCAACRAEYDDPGNRRFHAQPTACAACGPRLQLLDGTGRTATADDPLRTFAGAIQAGKIGALKGLGGYHLACRADCSSAVAELRRRKHRDEKPFAIMVADVAAAERLVWMSPAERQLLTSSRAPIVLLRKRANNGLAEEIAPRNPWLGIMLPYTPLHHLLMDAVHGEPLVMTSGNRSDEPIAYEDDAPRRLEGIADLFLVHDRAIHVRCDDSVTRMVDGGELLIRRSRGYAPRPIALPFECRQPILAVGGQLKATFALGRGRHAFVSHHLGDLDHYEAWRQYEKDVPLYERLFAVQPACLVRDRHPDYATTRYVEKRSAESGIAVLAVQHHHAHLASCLAENGAEGPAIGVAFDGTGYGEDGAIWGGEFLVGDYRNFHRAAHLRYVGMPGGDQAIREPWRMAIAHGIDAGVASPDLEARLLRVEVQTVKTMLERQFRSPPTSSAGRLFDAVAALAGVRDRVSYEGQAAIELEWLASDMAPDGSYPFEISAGDSADPTMIVDTRPIIRAVQSDATRDVSAATIARRFHSTMVEIIVEVCHRIRVATGIGSAALSGGVFLNAILTAEATERLTAADFRVYRHRLVPPNDGGLSLGQLAIAAATIGG